MLLAQCFADPAHSVVFSQYGFAVFPIATAAAGAQRDPRAGVAARSRDRAAAATISMRSRHAVRADTRLVYLANPNNPTGTWFDDADARTLRRARAARRAGCRRRGLPRIRRCAGLYAARCVSADRYPNLIVTRTFSKAYALGRAARRLSRSRIRVSSRCSSGCANRSTSMRSRSRRAKPRSAIARICDRVRAFNTPSATGCAMRSRARGYARAAVADEFPAGRSRARCGAARTPPVRARRDRAPDGRLRPCATRLRISVGSRAREPTRCSLHDACDDERWRYGCWTDAWTGSFRRPLRGEIAVPGDKSISHRAVMLAALADGDVADRRFPRRRGHARDRGDLPRAGRAHRDAVRVAQRIVHGVGLHGLSTPAAALDCGNSGTGMRLLAGLLAGQRFDTTLVGDESLSRRPMRRVIEPLALMGARIDAEPGGLPPLRIRAAQPRCRAFDTRRRLRARRSSPPSCWPGLYANGETEVREIASDPRLHRAHARRVRLADRYSSRAGRGFRGGHRLRATDVVVPADFSSAAFFIVAATLIPGSGLVLRAVGLNPRRTGLLARAAR